MTDDLGGYSVTVPADGILEVTFLGYTTQEIPVNGRTSIDIALEMEAEMLEDVIVVAYGTVRREAATGSVSTVSGTNIAEAPVTSVDKMLQGKVAGLTVSSNSGQPGATSNIRIRGTSSINAGNEPLWVVDGIPIITSDNRMLSNAGVGDGGTTASINPNDIESITVLKDAAAASIYGSRAANGVILVTTKSGKAGQSRFTARVKFGASVIANDNGYLPLTGSELNDYFRTAVSNAGYNPDDPSNPYYNSLPAPGTDLNATDWYKSLTDVYNPFSLLNAFAKQDIRNYWFASGTPTYLLRLLSHTDENLDELTGRYYSPEEFVDYKADVEKPLPMIYQSGYLTIKDYDRSTTSFLLDFPNNEVKSGFVSLAASGFSK